MDDEAIAPTNRASILGFWQSVLLARSGQGKEAVEVLRYTLSRDPAADPLEAPPLFARLLIQALVYARAGHILEARDLLSESTKSWQTQQARPPSFTAGSQLPSSEITRIDWADQALYVTMRGEIRAILALSHGAQTELAGGARFAQEHRQ